MPQAYDFTTPGLLLANLLIYGVLAFQLLRRRRKRLAKALTISDAFVALGPALKAAVRDLPAGYTWREGIDMARSTGVEVDWSRVGAALQAYEGFRYGGRAGEGYDYSEVLVLANALREAAGS